MIQNNDPQIGRNVPEEIRRFVNNKGQVTRWPAKNQRRALLDYLVEFFEPGRVYSEKEVNAILWKNITFEDFVTLRRTMCDLRLLERERDGSRYWRSMVKSVVPDEKGS